MPDQLETLKQVVANQNLEILLVASGKGGVGKSVFSVNLAVSLAKSNKNVLLFDADAGFANADILLGVTTRNTLRDYLLGNLELRDVIYPTSYGIWLLSSGTDVQDLVAFRSEPKQRLLHDFIDLAKDMNFAIVDTGAGFSDELISFYSAADKLFLVTTPEPTSLMNVYTLAKILGSRGIYPKLFLVMNQSRNPSKDTKVLERFSYVLEKFAGWQIEEKFILRHDAAVSSSVEKQVPLIEWHKHSQPALTIGRISKLVIQSSDGTREEEPAGFISKIKRLFGIK
ncbi:MAG TPA: P-loop NTPase [Thermotogota bacterium]|nr:P-loop NTPase [Thermotogota bacterium]HRW93145.1 P-loop NTPase [Thermotogota bacterium]